MGKSSGGRLVLTHSTHIPGLIAILDRLTQQPDIQTITPAVIGSVKSHTPHLKLKISVAIRGGFKVIARQGKTVQEVFVLTILSQEALEAAIEQVMKK